MGRANRERAARAGRHRWHRLHHGHRGTDPGRRDRLADGQARSGRRQPPLGARSSRPTASVLRRARTRIRTSSGAFGEAAGTSASRPPSSTGCTRSARRHRRRCHPSVRGGRELLRFYRASRPSCPDELTVSRAPPRAGRLRRAALRARLCHAGSPERQRGIWSLCFASARRSMSRSGRCPTRR